MFSGVLTLTWWLISLLALVMGVPLSWWLYYKSLFRASRVGHQRGWDGMGWDGMGWDGMGWAMKPGRRERVGAVGAANRAAVGSRSGGPCAWGEGRAGPDTMETGPSNPTSLHM
jgi:hypothetical protein